MNKYIFLNEKASLFFSDLSLIYLIVGVVLFIIMLGLIRIKISKEKNKVLQKKAQELLMHNLQAELRYKDAKLATLATKLTHKNEFLYKIKNDLAAVGKNDVTHSTSIKRLIHTVEKDIHYDSGDHFFVNFDTQYHSFLSRIRNNYPFLKSADLLLCAYLKMNKTNKEIAELLNVSEHAIKKRRVRLKQKLQLDHTHTLGEFLMHN